MTNQNKEKEPQMKKIKEIYLTAGDEDESLVWCENKVTEEDVKYIRADVVESSLLSQKKEMRKKIKKILRESKYQSYGWSNLEYDLKDILENLKQ